MGYGLRMQFAPRRRFEYLLGIIGVLAFFGCGKKDSPPTPEPAPKEIAAETKPAATEKPAPTAAATPAPTATENDPAKPATSTNVAAVTPTPTAVAKNPSTPNEVATAPNGTPQQLPPNPSEPPAPTIIPPAPVPEAPPPPPVESPKQTGQAFSVWLQSSGKYTAGQQGAVEAVVMPKGEFHCNQEYPYKFVTSSLSTGVTFPKSTYRAEGLSLSPTRAVMRIPFVPQSAGEARVGGTFHFSVCTDQQCVVEKRDVFVTVKVQ